MTKMIKESKVAPNEVYTFYEEPLKSPPSFIEKLERDAMDTNVAKIKIKSEEKTKSPIDRCNFSLSSQREDLKRFEDRGKDRLQACNLALSSHKEDLRRLDERANLT